MELTLVIIGRFKENRIQGRAAYSLTQPQCHPDYTAWNMTPSCVTQLPNTAASMVLSHHYWRATMVTKAENMSVIFTATEGR